MTPYCTTCSTCIVKWEFVQLHLLSGCAEDAIGKFVAARQAASSPIVTGAGEEPSLNCFNDLNGDNDSD
jgi:hypothetical protein